MNVRELIKVLESMPADALVLMAYDSAARGAPDCVLLSRSGRVVITESDEVLPEDDRPSSAPSASESPYWRPKDGWGA
jgi:hypothetical protein